MEDDSDAPLGELPGAFRSGESAADDVDGRRHGRIIEAGSREK